MFIQFYTISTDDYNFNSHLHNSWTDAEYNKEWIADFLLSGLSQKLKEEGPYGKWISIENESILLISKLPTKNIQKPLIIMRSTKTMIGKIKRKQCKASLNFSTISCHRKSLIYIFFDSL